MDEALRERLATEKRKKKRSPFRFRKDESISQAVRRIAHDQTVCAIEDLRSEDQHQGIHDARKKLKKLRALLRLVREEIGEKKYREENIRYRDAGRKLSDIRDDTTMLETLHRLEALGPDGKALKAIHTVREDLLQKREDKAREMVRGNNVTGEVEKMLYAGLKGIEGWPLQKKGSSGLQVGLKKVYKQGRDGLVVARGEPDVENLHDWRKRVKYLGNQLKLLRNVWPEVIKAHSAEAMRLAAILGDEHDIGVLLTALQEGVLEWPGKKLYNALEKLAETEQHRLRDEAFPLGERIYYEQPRVFADRVVRYWELWRG